jgi:hypothetical protein
MPHAGIAADNVVCRSINRTCPGLISGNNYLLCTIYGGHGNRCWQILLVLLHCINRIALPILAMAYTGSEQNNGNTKKLKNRICFVLVT